MVQPFGSIDRFPAVAFPRWYGAESAHPRSAQVHHLGGVPPGASRTKFAVLSWLVFRGAIRVSREIDAVAPTDLPVLESAGRACRPLGCPASPGRRGQVIRLRGRSASNYVTAPAFRTRTPVLVATPLTDGM